MLFGLGGAGASLPPSLASVGFYQNRMLAFVLAAAARMKHFSFVPLVNRQQIKFTAAERPWSQPASQPGQLWPLLRLCTFDWPMDAGAELPSGRLPQASLQDGQPLGGGGGG